MLRLIFFPAPRKCTDPAAIERIEDIKTNEIPLILRHQHTTICFRDGGDHHIDGVTRSAAAFAFRHQARPDQRGFFIEGQNAACEESLRPIGP